MSADPCDDRQPLRLGHAVFWALTWAVGAALGVAFGAWLTAAGAAGAPGGGVDLTGELIRLPALALAGVFVVHLGAQIAAEAWRSWRCSNATRR